MEAGGEKVLRIEAEKDCRRHTGRWWTEERVGVRRWEKGGPPGMSAFRRGWNDVGGTPTLLELRDEEFDEGGGSGDLGDPENEHPADDVVFEMDQVTTNFGGQGFHFGTEADGGVFEIGAEEGEVRGACELF